MRIAQPINWPASTARRRQSTTARLTLRVLCMIEDATILCEGVLVRRKGTETGIVAVVGDWLLSFDGEWINYRECTIPKSTVAHLDAIDCPARRVA